MILILKSLKTDFESVASIYDKVASRPGHAVDIMKIFILIFRLGLDKVIM